MGERLNRYVRKIQKVYRQFSSLYHEELAWECQINVIIGRSDVVIKSMNIENTREG